ncbi:hypothetical protein JCM8097_003269 [Rhodosporidiobolus ruineniae]
MSNQPAPPQRGALPAYLVSNTPPTPSRSPSNASTGGEGSGNDNEDESADDSDFPEGDDADPDASTLSLSHLSPALATPKPTGSSPWPFNEDGNATSMMALVDNDDGDEHHIPASSLPHEILLHILRLLPSSSLAPALRVCKAWCQCGVELLWHKPMFRTLPSLFRMLQVLNTPDPTFPYPHFVRRLNFNNLHDEMSDRTLSRLLPCTRIERLTLTGCKALTSAAMVSLLAQSKRLIALDLSDVDNVDDAVLEAMARNCSKLQGLNLSGCSKITDRGLELLAMGCPALRRIKLRKCEQLTDVPIILLSLHCPLLLEVDLAGCPAITSLSVMQLLRTSRALRELSLPGCVALTDDGFPDAENLILSSAASADAQYASPVSIAAPLLPSSSAADNTATGQTLTTTSGALIPLPLPLRSPPTYKPFDHLRYLDVTSCALLTDQAIGGIVKYAPRLRNLILAKCSRLTDDALFEICKIGKHLHYLHLGHVSSITDRAVTAIARSCTRLRYIDLACCNNLTDLSVFELASNLPRLKRIGLVRVTSITDQSLYALHARTTLERIHLSYCDNLTVAGVHELLQHLPRLTHLSLTGVSSFRKRELQQFCRPPPKDFNDHQRRSFCVFSGRGVQDIRKYFRSLSAPELAALAQPDPPDFVGPLNASGVGVGGQQLGAAPAGNPPPQAVQQMQQQRMMQLAQARQAVAVATVRLQQHQHARAMHQAQQAAAAAAAANGANGAAGGAGGGPGVVGMHPLLQQAQQQPHAHVPIPPMNPSTLNPPGSLTYGATRQLRQPIPSDPGVMPTGQAWPHGFVNGNMLGLQQPAVTGTGTGTQGVPVPWDPTAAAEAASPASSTMATAGSTDSSTSGSRSGRYSRQAPRYPNATRRGSGTEAGPSSSLASAAGTSSDAPMRRSGSAMDLDVDIRAVQEAVDDFDDEQLEAMGLTREAVVGARRPTRALPRTTAGAGGRPRGATVTRSNFTAVGMGEEEDDEEDNGSGSEGEEEDISMGDV